MTRCYSCMWCVRPATSLAPSSASYARTLGGTPKLVSTRHGKVMDICSCATGGRRSRTATRARSAFSLVLLHAALEHAHSIGQGVFAAATVSPGDQFTIGGKDIEVRSVHCLSLASLIRAHRSKTASMPAPSSLAPSSAKPSNRRCRLRCPLACRPRPRLASSPRSIVCHFPHAMTLCRAKSSSCEQVRTSVLRLWREKRSGAASRSAFRYRLAHATTACATSKDRCAKA